MAAGETERSELTAREAAQLAQQVAEALAAAQAASQTAQQAAQSINQVVSDMAQKLSSQATQVLQEETFGAEQIQAAVSGKTARLHATGPDHAALLFANAKRTYDEYQHESLETIRSNRSYVSKVLSDAQAHDNRTRQIQEQALQNAVETANMVAKRYLEVSGASSDQRVRHADIAIDHEWNLEPSQAAGETTVLRAVTIDDASLKAIGAAVAVAVSQALAGKKE